MRFEEYALKILQSTEASYIGLELDLRFDVITFLRRKLSERRMTQATLAAKLKMKPSQLNRILKAESNITLETVARIYHAFGCHPVITESYDFTKIAATEHISVKQSVIYDEPQQRVSIAGIH